MRTHVGISNKFYFFTCIRFEEIHINIFVCLGFFQMEKNTHKKYNETAYVIKVYNKFIFKILSMNLVAGYKYIDFPKEFVLIIMQAYLVYSETYLSININYL